MNRSMPIIEVTEDNFLTMLPALKKAIQTASFLAIDCELSGMGDRKKLLEPEIDLRYQYAAETARTHAVISLGLSCFTCKSLSTITLEEGPGQERSHDYLVQTFNILTLCSGSFTVECSAHKFLLRHGFDFNKLYAKGLQYYKGCDRQKNEAPCLRHLFAAIVEHRKPIIVHNGLLDLTFLYQSFYADLPKKLETFAADLTDMFPAGIYDTKYIAEFHQHMPASYLEYLFKKMQLKGARLGREGEWHVRVNFPPYPSTIPCVEWHPYEQILSYSIETDEDKREVCIMQALHGWCGKGMNCLNSHNINKIVKTLQPQGAKKRGNSKYSGPNNNASLAQIIQRQASKSGEGDSEEATKRKRDSQETTKRKRKSQARTDKEVQEGTKRVEESKKEPKGERDSEEEPKGEGDSEEEPKGEGDSEEELKGEGDSEEELKGEGYFQDGTKRKISSTVETEGQNKKIKLKNPETFEEKENKKTSVPMKKPDDSHKSSGHRAGFDAFMTGYIFASHVSTSGALASKNDLFTSENLGMSHMVNKVYLMGKSIPFLIRAGLYASMSSNHTSKIPNLRKVTVG